MSNIVPIGQARMPAGMKARVESGRATNKNFSGGIRDTFPVLSIKGKVFRLRKDGKELPILNPDRTPVQTLDVVLVNACRTLSKQFYAKGFDESELTPPDCWSLDAVRPDPSIAKPVNPTCANCPNNVFGSAMAQDGSARGGKACADTKRIAVIMPQDLKAENPMVFLLRVPATSLKNLKLYTDNLAHTGWDQAACVTRLKFDYAQAYPKLDFDFVDGLDDDEYEKVAQVADSVQVASMLAAPDFDAGTTKPQPAPVPEPEPVRVRQSGVVIGEEREDPAANRQTKAEEKKPDLKVVPDEQLVELPEGKYLNLVTGEVIEPPPPKVQMPEKDPDVIALTDGSGRFYNKRTKTFVTGDTNAAQQVSDAPVKKTRPARKKPAPAEPMQEDNPAAPQQAQAEQEVKPAANGKSGVEPASADLEAMLKDLVPTHK
jgi:hypothetical protein